MFSSESEEARHLSKVLGHDAVGPLQAVLQGLGRVSDVTAVHNHLERPLLFLLGPALQLRAQLPHVCHSVLLTHTLMSYWT